MCSMIAQFLARILVRYYLLMLLVFCIFFFFSSRRRHTRCREVSWARRCVQETASYCAADYREYIRKLSRQLLHPEPFLRSDSAILGRTHASHRSVTPSGKHREYYCNAVPDSNYNAGRPLLCGSRPEDQSLNKKEMFRIMSSAHKLKSV
eukprot:TRINITY_DN25434_c0_g1_i1.p3 TRINITY_DN25434_c0_g1~~TRINITY_DN25434_c0_g1_i1.p3  ORF type:complete len:150 (-),score=27.70 TRINITY_DN25434_c0_g1_i1:51-500(-)